MASTSQSTLGPTGEARIYLDLGSLRFVKSNSKIQEVDKDDPTNRRGYTFLRFCEDEVWTAKKCKAVYEYLMTVRIAGDSFSRVLIGLFRMIEVSRDVSLFNSSSVEWVSLVCFGFVESES